MGMRSKTATTNVTATTDGSSKRGSRKEDGGPPPTVVVQKGLEELNLADKEEEQRRMSTATTATGGPDEPAAMAGGSTEMSQAIMEMVRPAVERLDEQVKNTRKSQLYLANYVDQLSSKLKTIVDDQTLPYDLEVYVRKLDDSRKRVTGVNQRLQALHSRVSQLQRNIAREAYKQKQQHQQPTSQTQQ